MSSDTVARQIRLPSLFWRGVFLSVVATVFFVFPPYTFAQERATVEKRVQVKLTGSAKRRLVGTTGILPKTMEEGRTGIRALDRRVRQYEVRRMERVFRPAGKHEARHVRWGLDRWYVIYYDANVSPTTVAKSYLEAEAQIEAASPIYKKSKTVLDQGGRGERDRSSATGDAPPQPNESNSFVPNDPKYSAQWHYENTSSNVGTADADIDLPEAHAIEAGRSGVVVSVVDGGLDLDHPEFQGMLWINDAEDINGNGTFEPDSASNGGDLNGVDDDNNGFIDDVIGYDHADDDPVPSANGDHGTHVAGIIAAKNGNGAYGAGVAGGGSGDSGIRLMISQTFSNTVGGFAEAIVYAADNGAVVSQNSWGYTKEGEFQPAVLDAIDYFRATAGGERAPMDGGIFVNAAGNKNSNGKWYPGYYGPSFTVSATNEVDNKAVYSNYGSWVDVAAPGGNVDGCDGGADGVQSTIIGGFGPLCGTSMAAPHVSGLIGLVASHKPGMTNDRVETLLRVSGEDVGSDFRIGNRINAFRALTTEVDSIPPAPIDDLTIVSLRKGQSGAQATLEWTAPGDEGDTTGAASSYALRYSTQGPITDSTAWANAASVEGEPAPDTVGTTQRFQLPNTLPFGETVYFALRATDEFDNMSALGNSPSGQVPLGLVNTTPAAHATSADTSASLTLTFSQEIDPATVRPDSIVVMGGQTGMVEEADSSVTVSGDQVTYDPIRGFQPGEQVRVSVRAGIASTGGIALETTETFEFVAASAPASGTFPRQIAITDSANGVRDVHVVDIDGDGTLDVVWGARVSADNEGVIAWHEKDGGYGKQVRIASAVPQIGDLHPADVDADGDVDIVSASQAPAWYENAAGDGESWVEHPIDTGAPVPSDAHVADVDADADRDVLFAAGLERVLWMEHEDGAGDSWRLHDVASEVVQPVSVYAGDADADGDMDVFVAHNAIDSGDKIAWYENEGEGTFRTQHVISTEVAAPTDVYAADVNRDGRLDVLSASNNDSKVAWYPNVKDGGFGTQQVVTTGARPQNIRTADIDGDKDLDVLSADQHGNRIAWHENGDSGGFSDTHVVTTALSEAQAVAAGDADGDGDLDLFSASSGSDTVAWYENAAINASPTAKADEYQTVAGSTLVVSEPGVLGNDTDPEGDSLAAALVDSTSGGAITLSADGSFEYVPDAGFAGEDRFTYEASAPNGAADTAAVTIQVESGSLTRSLSLSEGWNLVSIPLRAGDQSFEAMLPPCESGFFFNPGEGYQSIAEGETVPPGRGFFANCSAGTVGITGTVPDTQTVVVKAGWNVVGPFADSVDVGAITSDPAGIVQTSFFGFDPSSGYESATSLASGLGYWVKASERGTLVLSGDSTSGTALAATSLQKLDGARLVLTDAAGRAATLYLVPDATDEQLRRGALPPVPPGGTFDVRFANGRSIVDVGARADGLHRIETQGLAYPVEATLEGASAGQRLRLRRGVGAEAEETRLSPENPKVTLSTTARLKVGLRRVPAEFALRKSAPNPVRRRARIGYAVPTKTHVTIVVYDVLGRAVARLVEGPRRAGRYSVTLEARRLPSGTYFYRMRAEGFTKTRRVTVVR